MDQEQIVTALAIERTGSFTRAAESLNITQSTVTARIRQLENELGVQIWERTTRRLLLTSEGTRLMALFAQSALIFDRMLEVSDTEGFAHHLVFGSVHSQWSSGVLPLLMHWTKTHPRLTWRLVTGHSRELLDHIRAGTLDGAITYFPAGEHGMPSVLLAQQHLVLVGSPSARAWPSTLTSDALRNLPLAYLNWGEPFTSWFAREFVELMPAIQVDQAPLLLEVLTSGQFVGFMPKALAKEAVAAGKLVYLNFRASVQLPTRDVYLVASERSLARQITIDLWNHLTKQAPGVLGDD